MIVFPLERLKFDDFAKNRGNQCIFHDFRGLWKVNGTSHEVLHRDENCSEGPNLVKFKIKTRPKYFEFQDFLKLQNIIENNSFYLIKNFAANGF